MDPDLFILPDRARHADSQPGAGAQCHGCASRQGHQGQEGSGIAGSIACNTVPAGSAGRSLSGSLCCSPVQGCCLGWGCRAQSREGEPLAGCSRCHVSNVAAAGFLLSCKKFTWSIRMGCHSPTNASMAWCGPDSWLIDLIHCPGKQTYETWQAV